LLYTTAAEIRSALHVNQRSEQSFGCGVVASSLRRAQGDHLMM
jgi:hypothetical protein